jgi:hypothetical protein
MIRRLGSPRRPLGLLVSFAYNYFRWKRRVTARRPEDASPGAVKPYVTVLNCVVNTLYWRSAMFWQILWLLILRRSRLFPLRG